MSTKLLQLKKPKIGDIISCRVMFTYQQQNCLWYSIKRWENFGVVMILTIINYELIVCENTKHYNFETLELGLGNIHLDDGLIVYR